MKEIYRPCFTYTLEHIGADGRIKSVETVKNIIPKVGLEYILGAAFKGVSQFTNWYLSVFTANRLPVYGDDMASLLADCQEDTGYTVTGGARKLITLPAIVDASMSILKTSPSVNIFDYEAGATVRGAFITTNITRGNNSGLLVSAVLFQNPKVIAAGESLRVPLGFSLTSV